MPNQRSKKKAMVGGFVNYKVKQAIQSIAIEEDLTLTEVLESILNEGVERYKVSGSLNAPKPAEKPPKKQ
jgi:hypothetical protein